MANQHVFCNTPWYEAHIYWDGSLGICCQESRKLYYNDLQYNIRNMTLAEWFNSPPVKQLRLDVLKSGTDACSRCYTEESVNSSSRRHRSNQKSVIFTKTAFTSSFEQSPGYEHFKFSEAMGGITNTMPIDIHIDLGNHCNLACKMCHPRASTKIATQYVKWNIADAEQYLGVDWTADIEVWNQFLAELVAIPKLKNIHIMGGETLLSPRFEQLVDYMILHQRFDVSFSFVTNGTVYKPELIAKLKNFSRVGIEISIETATIHNDYIRQGSKITEVLDTIAKYQALCDNSSVSVTLRTAISILSIGYYHTLLTYCLDNKLLIKSLLVTTPDHLNCNLLPRTIRDAYIAPYLDLQNQLSDLNINLDFNESDPNQYRKSIKVQVEQVINLLASSDTPHVVGLQNLVTWCKRWDSVYGLNAMALYPEFEDIFNQYGY